MMSLTAKKYLSWKFGTMKIHDCSDSLSRFVFVFFFSFLFFLFWVVKSSYHLAFTNLFAWLRSCAEKLGNNAVNVNMNRPAHDNFWSVLDFALSWIIWKRKKKKKKRISKVTDVVLCIWNSCCGLNFFMQWTGEGKQWNELWNKK